MGLRRPRRERDDATFDLTPMIDVVLLLIIFFMLTSQFAQSGRAEVSLPDQAGLSGEESRGAELVIDLDARGETRIFGRDISIDGILNEAANANAIAKAGRGTVRVLLRADQNCPASAVQNLCAALINIGIRTVSIGTSGEKSG